MADPDVIHLAGRGSCKPCQAGNHDRCDTGGDWPTPCVCWAFDNHGRRPARSVDDTEADYSETRHHSNWKS